MNARRYKLILFSFFFVKLPTDEIFLCTPDAILDFVINSVSTSTYTSEENGKNGFSVRTECFVDFWITELQRSGWTGCILCRVSCSGLPRSSVCFLECFLLIECFL